MIDRLDAVRADGARDQLAVEHRTEDCHDQRPFRAFGQRACRLPDFDLDLVKRILRRLKQHQHARRLPQDLPHQFRPDGTAGACHHHALGRHAACQQLLIRRHWIAPEQILCLDRSQIGHRHPPRRDILQLWQRPHHDRQRLEMMQHFRTLGPCCLRNGEQHLLDTLPLDNARQPVRPENLVATDVLTP